MRNLWRQKVSAGNETGCRPRLKLGLVGCSWLGYAAAPPHSLFLSLFIILLCYSILSHGKFHHASVNLPWRERCCSIVQYLPCCCVQLHITILSDPCSTRAFVYLPHSGWCIEWKYQKQKREFASCILNVPSSSLGCRYNNGRLAWYYFFLVFSWHHVSAELRSLLDQLSIPWVRDQWILKAGGIIIGSWNRSVRRSTCLNVSFFP